MRILLDMGSYDLQNLGAVATLQASVAALRAADRRAELHVVTDHAERLRALDPALQPVPTGPWEVFGDRSLVAALTGRLSGAASGWESMGKAALRRNAPRVLAGIAGAKARVLGREPTGARGLAPLEHVDAVILNGLAGFGGGAVHALALLELALGMGRPVACLGVGIYPRERDTPALLHRWAAVLRRSGLILQREARLADPWLDRAGVPRARRRLTGDSAIGLAAAQAPDQLGDALGLSVRLNPSTGFGEADLAQLAGCATAYARGRQVRLVPVVTSLDPAAGEHERLVRALALADDPPPRNPVDAIRALAPLRVLVAGTYHAAVFALAQGIPVICIARTSYFRQKFEGLAQEFPEGCSVVEWPAARGQLEGRIEATWERAPDLRSAIRRTAERQAGAFQAGVAEAVGILGSAGPGGAS